MGGLKTENSTHAVLVLCDDESQAAPIREHLRIAFPQVDVLQFSLPPPNVPGAQEMDVAIVRAVSNSGFRRVAAIRRAHPELPIIVLGDDRDRSSAAYVNGANEYVSGHDHAKLEQLVRAALPI